MHGYFILLKKTAVYIIHRIIHVFLEMPDLFPVLNMIQSHSFAVLTREISRSTLKINLVYFHAPMYHSLFILDSTTGN